MDNKRAIEIGKNLLRVKRRSMLFTDFNIVYPTTTENIKGTYALFNLKDKDILTVASSADHIFCAMVGGVKSIDSFDINYLTDYYYHFKKAFIKSYDLEEFKNIFLYSIIVSGIIKEDWYLKIRDNLEGKYLEFWDEVIYYCLNNNLLINNLFLNATFKPRLINYLEDDNYKKLKDALDVTPVSFIHSDITDLNEKLSRKYDYMFLSNISDYVGIRNMRKLSLEKLKPHLNKNGEIVYAYLYSNPFRSLRFITGHPITSTIDVTEKDYVLSLK